MNALTVALARRGFVFCNKNLTKFDSWNDILEGNLKKVGLLPDGTPVITDPSALISVNVLHSIENHELMKKAAMVYDFSRVVDEPNYQWSGKQELYFADAKAQFKDVAFPEDLRPEKRRADDVFLEWPPQCGM